MKLKQIYTVNLLGVAIEKYFFAFQVITYKTLRDYLLNAIVFQFSKNMFKFRANRK